MDIDKHPNHITGSTLLLCWLCVSQVEVGGIVDNLNPLLLYNVILTPEIFKSSDFDWSYSNF